MTILNSNLVYGRGAHLIHYMAQCAAAGKINASIGGSQVYHYKPVSSDDLALAVETALTNFANAKGQNYIVNGEHEHTLN
jgi:nucleoside-diphosphate-sugar epimerase